MYPIQKMQRQDGRHRGQSSVDRPLLQKRVQPTTTMANPTYA
ncbi:hypothetical protein SAMN03159453_03814 [Pseudomonas sp. NFIX28]|nr:hypothetical protein SAMN03159453_03814 [Pseudomonas sp. NFIX28]